MEGPRKTGGLFEAQCPRLRHMHANSKQQESSISVSVAISIINLNDEHRRARSSLVRNNHAMKVQEEDIFRGSRNCFAEGLRKPTCARYQEFTKALGWEGCGRVRGWGSQKGVLRHKD